MANKVEKSKEHKRKASGGKASKTSVSFLNVDKQKQAASKLANANQQLQELLQKLKASQRDLNRAQAVAQTGSWRLDIQRNELLWSDETYRIFGIPKGTPMTYEKFLLSVHPEDREYVDRKWKAALGGEPYDIENRIVVGDEVKWISEKAELEFDQKGALKGGFGTIQDITQHKQMEAQLSHLASFPELNPNPVIELDITGEIRYLNPSAKKIFPDMEIMGGNHPFCKGCKSLIRTEIIEQGESVVREVLIGNTWYEQTCFHVPGGTIRIYSRDITESKRLNELKDEFIGMVSHEMRTPLTVVISAVKTAMDERVSSQEMRELLTEASSSANSLGSILDNLLELSRYQAGRLTVDKKLENILEITQKAVQRVTRKYDTQRIILDIPDKLPEASIDASKMEQILYNLVENAVKFSPAGSEVRIFARQEKENLVIGVRDRGAGIAPEDQKKMFEPFTRLVGSRSKGIGLGLVVCKRLVEAHGGRIWVESKPGEGSTFLFTIPLGKKKLNH